jgi:hypothetical protein
LEIDKGKTGSGISAQKTLNFKLNFGADIGLKE